MANFMKLNARAEQRIGEYATRLLRIEAHLRRGEKRAAAARLAGFKDELAGFLHDLEFPVEMTVIGAQLGFFSGKGSLVRGRLPAALLGGVAGWFFGQSQTAGHQRYIEEIYQRVDLIEHALAAEAAAEAAAEEVAAKKGSSQSPAESA